MVHKQEYNDSQVIVAEPDRSAEWEANKIVLIVMCVVSGSIGVAFLMVFIGVAHFAGIKEVADLMQRISKRIKTS